MPLKQKEIVIKPDGEIFSAGPPGHPAWDSTLCEGLPARNDGLYNDRAGTNPGDAVTVTITHTYNFVVLPAFLDGISDINLSATTVMNMMQN